MRHGAWLMLEGGERHDCTLSDISDKGARINVHTSDLIPESFMLLLAANGVARRRCRVIWRTPYQVGVKFETRLDYLARATRVSKSRNSTVKVAEPAESSA
jgi:hypothetical protein